MRTITYKAISGLRAMLIEEERSAATVEKYIREATEFAVWLGERALCREAVNEWKNKLLADGLMPQTVNGKLSSVNSLLRFLGREDCRSRTLRIQQQVFRSEERELTREEYKKLVNAARRLKNRKLELILETLCSGGMRVSELGFITVEAVRSRSVTVRQKGKCRTILLPNQLTRKLELYAKEQGISSGRIFITRTGREMNRRQIWAEMKKLCGIAGVAPSKVFPHNLRHLFATEFYRVSKDIAKLADILGHSSISTTRRYLISTGAEHRELMEEMRLIS